MTAADWTIVRDVGKAQQSEVSDLDVTASVSNGLVEYFGPFLFALFVAALFSGSTPASHIVLFVGVHVTMTAFFSSAKWLSQQRTLPGYQALDKAWYVTAAFVSASLPWIIAPQPRWSHYALGLIYTTIVSSDTLSISLRADDRGWKWLLGLISGSFAMYLALQQRWAIALYCICYGLHLLGGHDALQTVVRRLIAQRRQSDVLATTDPLTGLANRRGLSRYIDDALAQGADQLTIAAVDIDDFKRLNDRFGHVGGDIALQHVAGYMSRSCGDDWLVVRSGGDEFTLASTSASPDDLDDILSAIPSFVCEDSLVRVRVSVGVTTGAPTDPLLPDASAALRLSKRNGKQRITIVDDDLRAELRGTRKLSNQLAEAVAKREIEIWAQPIVRLTGPDSGSIHSYECLARWATPDGVAIPPSTFIPLIEDQRLTRELGEVIIGKAAAFLASLDDSVSVAVNVSATHFTSNGFAEFLHGALAKHGVAPHRLTIEITESEDLPADVSSWAIARQLAEMGVGLSIDDFGTGYASLERLIQFPYNQLKLDRSIAGGAAGSGLRYLLEGFGRMSREMDLEIVAEGIEDREQAELLRSVGIPLGQGYLFCRPRPVDEILREQMATDARLAQLLGTEEASDSRISAT